MVQLVNGLLHAREQNASLQTASFGILAMVMETRNIMHMALFCMFSSWFAWFCLLGSYVTHGRRIR